MVSKKKEDNILSGKCFKNKNCFEYLAQKILLNLTEDDIDEFQTLQLEDEIKGGKIQLDIASLKVYQMKSIIEDAIIRNPELQTQIKYKSVNRDKAINILMQLNDDKYLDNYDLSKLPQRNPYYKPIADILKRFGTKTLTQEEQEIFIKEFNNNPTNIYEGLKVDSRTDEKIKPLDHQKKFIQQFAISNLRGVIAFHGVGSGKTLTAVISSYYFLRMYPDRKVVVISPSALLFNFLAGMIQYGLDIRDNRYKFFTYDKYLRKPFDTTGALVIIDEAHNFRTEITKKIEIDSHGDEVEVVKTNKRGFKLMHTATKNCYKLILLTGTAFVNGIYDIENLLSMVDNRPPISNATYIDTISNPANLSSYFDYKISYYERGPDANFPKTIDHYVDLYMSPREEEEYEKMKKEGTPEAQARALKLDKEITPQKANSFYSAEQYASNTILNDRGINSKVEFVISKIQEKPNEKFIIYSSFIHTGIDNIVSNLKKLNLPRTEMVFITGRESAKQKESAKQAFNYMSIKNWQRGGGDNNIRILFITKAGAEGVDTIECNNIILFDELWNDATSEQVIARAVRYKSHSNLPENERFVNIWRPLYLKEADEELFNLVNEELNPDWKKIDEKIKGYKVINKLVDTGLNSNKIKALPNFDLAMFNDLGSVIPKAPVGDKEAQATRREKIKQLEIKFLKKTENDFKNGKRGFKVMFRETDDVKKYLKNFTTIRTAYGKKNLSRELPSFVEMQKSPFFDYDEFSKALKIGQEEVYDIQVYNTIQQQNKKAVLSPDLLSSIEKDEKKPIPAIDLFKFILTKSKEQKIRYFIEHFDKGNGEGDIELYESYESNYRKEITRILKRDNIELTPEIEFKLLQDIVKNEINKVADVLHTQEHQNKIEEFNKRTKAEKLQQFYTPPEVAYELFDLMMTDKPFNKLENITEFKILEPTAGLGGLLVPIISPQNENFISKFKLYYGLAKTIQKLNTPETFDFSPPISIDLVEIDKENKQYLKDKLMKKAPLLLNLQDEGNFLKFGTSTRYDMIITNPPFHLRKGENVGLTRDVWDIDFIIKSIALLKIGGILGAIIGKASEKNKIFNKLGNIGKVNIVNIGKKKFGSITTPVIFLTFIKESTEFDNELLSQLSDIYTIDEKKVPDFVPVLPNTVEIIKKFDILKKDIGKLKPIKLKPEPEPEPEPEIEIPKEPIIKEPDKIVNRLEDKIKEFEKVGKEKGAVIYDSGSFIQSIAYIALLLEYGAKCAIIDKDLNKIRINSKERSPMNMDFYKSANILGRDLVDCIKRGEKMIAVPLRLNFGTSNTGHANMLIYRPLQGTIERFEPHGKTFQSGGKDDDTFNKVLKRMFEVEMKPFLKEYTPKFIKPDEVCPNPKGFQSLEGQIRKLGSEGGGFCGMWSLFVLELIFINHDKTTLEIMDEAFDITQADPQYLSNVIRGYVIKTEKLLDSYIKKIDNTGFSYSNPTSIIGKRDKIQEDLLGLLLSFKSDNSNVDILTEIVSKGKKKTAQFADVRKLLLSKSKSSLFDMIYFITNRRFGAKTEKKMSVEMIVNWIIDERLSRIPGELQEVYDYYNFKGGKIKKSELKQFVEAGYKKKKDVKTINGYQLDTELSTKRDKVYYDPETKKAVHTIAGADKLKDWSNNLLIPLGLHKLSNRYKNSERIQKEANSKYGKANTSLVSHSQSGNIANNLSKKGLVGDDNVALNPAIIGFHDKGVKVVKAKGDPVSLLTITNKRDKNISTGSWNPLYNHSTKIL